MTLGHEMMHFPSLVELVHVELLHALCQTVVSGLGIVHMGDMELLDSVG